METKQTVLITGATSGIGKELALLFAKEQYKLVIVARNKQKLQSTADELKENGSPQVTPISCDLSVAGNAQLLYEQIHERGIQIDVLINDAGAGEHGLFSETSLEEELAIIQLNITSLVHLTKLYLREMVERNEGKILQLASIASYQPTPLLTVYAATKAFVLSFTDALINELQDTNISVTALVNGQVEFATVHGSVVRAAARGLPVKSLMVIADRPAYEQWRVCAQCGYVRTHVAKEDSSAQVFTA